MKKITLFFILLTSLLHSQSNLTLSQLNSIWGTGHVPIGINLQNTFYTLTQTVSISSPSAAGSFTLSISNGNRVNIPISGAGWDLVGNAGTVDLTNNYIGTTDINQLNFLTGNVSGGRIDGDKTSAYFGQLSYTGGTGTGNTAMGHQALTANTTGARNVAIGFQSLYSNLGSTQNTAVGNLALTTATASNNTAIGYKAGWLNTTGAANVIIGSTAALNMTSGSNNIFIGVNSAPTNQTGINHTIIGTSADVSDALKNCIAIGYLSTVTTGSMSVIGNTSTIGFGFNGALMPNYGGYNAGTTGQYLQSQGINVAPQWVTLGSAIVGTTTNDNASAGNVGEYVSRAVAIGAAGALTTATTTTITSISLTAGDWIVSGNVNFSETVSTVTARAAGITSTALTIPVDGSEGNCGTQSVVTSELNSIVLQPKRISIAGTTVIYLLAKATFSAGTCAGYGTINAWRAR